MTSPSDLTVTAQSVPRSGSEEYVAATAGALVSTTAISAALTASYIAATQAIRARVIATVRALFGAQGYRNSGADAYVTAMVPAAEAAQETMAAVTDAYLAQQVGFLSGTSTGPAGVPMELVTGEALRHVDPAVVYRRPYTQMWTDLSNGKTLEQAVANGQRRAESIALTDLQLAKTRTAQTVLSQDQRAVGYRRVLTGPYSCGLCIVASTQRYHKADLMPIHPGCDCVILPIVGNKDPGRSINSAVLTGAAQPTEVTTSGVPVYHQNDMMNLGDLLEPVHQAIQDRFGYRATGARALDYRKVLLTHHHGELGPVLTVADQLFTKKQVKSGDFRAVPGTYGKKRG